MSAPTIRREASPGMIDQRSHDHVSRSGSRVRSTGPVAAGPIEVHTFTIDSPLGKLLLIGGRKGLLRVVFECEGHDAVLEGLSARLGAHAVADSHGLDDTASQLDDYFGGRRRVFDLMIDRSLMTPFQWDVLTHVNGIGYGQTRCYADVAASVGNPRAARAVGGACARNPVPIIIPCHRVVPAARSIGHYLAGTSAKRLLIDLEMTRTATASA